MILNSRLHLSRLIPTKDVSTCPLAGLLDMEQRQIAAGRLNTAVLKSQQQEKGPWLPDLLRQLVHDQVAVFSFALGRTRAVHGAVQSSSHGEYDG